MLQKTFIHIPGFGENKEKFLWNNNINSWDDFLDNYKTISLPESTKFNLKCSIIKSKENLENNNHSYFSENLPISQHWRAYKTFDKVCFLDIETTGLSKQRNKITTIGMYDGKESKVFIRHQNMDEFPEELAKYSTIISFNGRRFDIPFIKEKFPGIKIDHFHIDLCFLMRELGYTGGLKRIEKEIGIARGDDIEGVDGYEAVKLWYRYRKGDEEALKKLVAYNIADVENLQVMMDFAYEKKLNSI
jgi:uncharacterized protein